MNAEAWNKLTPDQRNNLVGERLGMKPLTQCYIGLGGKSLLRTCYTEEQIVEARKTVEFMSATAANWKHFLREMPSLQPEMRGKLDVIVERWHIRYSDTPGGGWDVIEWLRSRGPVNVASIGDQWRVAFGDDAETATTMAEAACLMALRVAA